MLTVIISVTRYTNNLLCHLEPRGRKHLSSDDEYAYRHGICMCCGSCVYCPALYPRNQPQPTIDFDDSHAGLRFRRSLTFTRFPWRTTAHGSNDMPQGRFE
jgi:hypothetical protein